MRFGVLVLGLFVGFRAFCLDAGRCFPFFFSPADPPAQCRARVRVIASPSEAQDCRFFVFVQVRPSDALLNAEPGGDQGTLFTHNVAQIYIRDCVLSFILLLLYFFFYFFRLNTSHPRGAVGDVTFQSEYLSFPHLTPRYASGPREVFGMTISFVLAPVFPFPSTKVCLAISPFLWFI